MIVLQEAQLLGVQCHFSALYVSADSCESVFFRFAAVVNLYPTAKRMRPTSRELNIGELRRRSGAGRERERDGFLLLQGFQQIR